MMIEFVAKVGWPLLILHIGGPQGALHKSVSLSCISYSALWQHRLSTLLSSSCIWRIGFFVAEVIGQKQSLVLNRFCMWGKYGEVLIHGSFCFCSFPFLKIGSCISQGSENLECMHFFDEMNIFHSCFYACKRSSGGCLNIRFLFNEPNTGLRLPLILSVWAHSVMKRL